MCFSLSLTPNFFRVCTNLQNNRTVGRRRISNKKRSRRRFAGPRNEKNCPARSSYYRICTFSKKTARVQAKSQHNGHYRLYACRYRLASSKYGSIQNIVTETELRTVGISRNSLWRYELVKNRSRNGIEIRFCVVLRKNIL